MKRAFTLIEALIVLALVLIVAAILFPVFARHGTPPRRSSCQSNLKQIGLGLMQYVQDYDEFLPTISIGTPSGWSDATYPYLKTWQIFQCPSTTNPATATPLIDYFFNGRLSRGYLMKVKWPGSTIMAGEGQDNAPTWAIQSQLPPQWLADQNSPSWRHLGTGNYLFADGHVKALKPNAISNRSPSSATATFAIR